MPYKSRGEKDKLNVECARSKLKPTNRELFDFLKQTLRRYRSLRSSGSENDAPNSSVRLALRSEDTGTNWQNFKIRKVLPLA